ncbi:sporulation protein [Marinobacter salinexigens]|uniref:Sporulation protein n=1 Tax=Marinobacter salinexigens TaxID=2919747 RepID=A0A5B0VKT6_9GAMM|nr:SPOR domain-containing protein [Marinobacter salinexigens]KAA1175126.1 sporulation protein [Marinobacter salinexigens]
MDGLKQRIIGALVLVSLAVIFVPMVFDEPHSERTSTSIKIPEEPPFPEVTAPESRDVDSPSYNSAGTTDGASDPVADPVDDAPGYRLVEEPDVTPPQTAEADPVDEPAPVKSQAEQESAQSAAAEPEKNAKVEASEYTRSLEGAWVVQLGSFGNADNAKRLRDGVREKGYGAHLQQVARGDTTLTRVFSGPFVSKSDAESAKKVLDKAFSLNSLVTTGDK